MNIVSIDEQIKIIAKGADEIINLDELREKLERAQKKGAPLTVKLGIALTAQAGLGCCKDWVASITSIMIFKMSLFKSH